MPTTLLHQEIARAIVDYKLEGMRERCQEQQHAAHESAQHSGRRRHGLRRFVPARAGY